MPSVAAIVATSCRKVADFSAPSAMARAVSGLLPLTRGESSAHTATGPPRTTANTNEPSRLSISAPVRQGRRESAPDEEAERGGELRHRV